MVQGVGKRIAASYSRGGEGLSAFFFSKRTILSGKWRGQKKGDAIIAARLAAGGTGQNGRGDEYRFYLIGFGD